mmetsp:Transcript_10636/g.21998  ORF Transcript_10636/g.21998 Transcript_10636/m.21998 type:complete len:474 (-) Transcript_10636:50-1471(-)
MEKASNLAVRSARASGAQPKGLRSVARRATGGSCASAQALRVRTPLTVASRKQQRRGVSRPALLDETASELTAEVASVASVAEGEALIAPPAGFSGLEGKALRKITSYPTKREVLAAIPKECFKRDTVKSMSYAIFSTSLTLALGVGAYALIPLKLAFLPVWALYAVVTGTVATGSWVVAHECGHDAFSDNKKLQDTVGFVLHSLLLVPYFSWQRSHAVHHSRTNHMEEGETHVPFTWDSVKGQANYALKEVLGPALWNVVNLFIHLVVGWPAYLISGATGGTKYGVTNHFWPIKPFSDGLFPTDFLKKRVWISGLGVAATVCALAAWAVKAKSVVPVLAVYGLPYLVVNFWLVLYTWLQHTDVDVPHFTDKDWDWVKGTFMTIDRPYPPVVDFLHHKIGTTHVAHHVAHQIPHYNARKATEALKEAFPDLYLYDPTPITKAMLRVGEKCVAVKPFPTDTGDKYLFVESKNDL